MIPLSPMNTLPSGDGTRASLSAFVASYVSQSNTFPTGPDVDAARFAGAPCGRGGMGRYGISPRISPFGTPAISGFTSKPSYQNSFSAGIEPRAGKSNRI